jgi:hypothetical protein
MLNDPAGDSRLDPTRSNVLLVADWTVDAHAVVAEARRHRAARSNAAFGVVVPAWLHGLDWAGDPRASFPCARRQVAAIGELAAAAGLPVDAMMVGDPDPLAAICDAILDWPVDEVLLFARGSRFSRFGPLDLQHRVHRSTGLPVRRVGMRGTPRHRLGTGTRSGHCVPDLAAVA